MDALLFQTDAKLPHVTSPEILITKEYLGVVSGDALLGDLWAVGVRGDLARSLDFYSLWSE